MPIVGRGNVSWQRIDGYFVAATNAALEEGGSKAYRDGIAVELAERRWKTAYIDLSGGPAKDDVQICKTRIELLDGTVYCIADLSLSGEPEVMLDEIWNMKYALFRKNKWYGLKIRVDPHGKCEWEFNHDAKCSLDEHFWDPVW